MTLEHEYLSSLKNKEEQTIFLQKSKEERKEILENFKKDKENSTIDGNFKKIGISHPSSELEEAFSNLSLSSKLGGVFAGLAGATMSLKGKNLWRSTFHTQSKTLL